MTRRELREHCFKMLFSADFYPTREEAIARLEQYFQSPEEDDTDAEGVQQILHRVDFSEKSRRELEQRTTAIIEKIPEIDEKLDQVAAGWKTKRMGKVELTILRLAVYEMEYDDSIPDKVSVNEAVELAKKFGGSDSPSFVNGVLAKCMAGAKGVSKAPKETRASEYEGGQPAEEGKDPADKLSEEAKEPTDKLAEETKEPTDKSAEEGKEPADQSGQEA